MDDAEFWAIIGSTSRWERGHLAHLIRQFTALGPEGAAERWREAVARAQQLAQDLAPDTHPSTIMAVLDYVLEGRAGVEALLTVDWSEAEFAQGRAFDLQEKLAAFYERETQTPFPYPTATAPARIWAQQCYSEAGLPRDLVAGIDAAFEAVEASPEIVAALDAAGLRNLEMTGTLSHDARRGWLVGTRPGSWVRVRKRKWDVVVNFQWDTSELSRMRYADGLRLVCELVDTLAARRPGFPASRSVVGLSELVEVQDRHIRLRGKERMWPVPRMLDHHAALDQMEALAHALEARRRDR